ncbi:L,D-transpeptidase [Roseibacillus persicicus]|uniref:Peptidase n=1 Tax=Roseibacillus persicicus TaxID=454148 RepID=A0A918TXX4_9BACT|nr:L,D-transpeptidase [Roseibacillus persicicus]GHC66481.1 peptidase [Roseibacillus persicicus]
MKSLHVSVPDQRVRLFNDGQMILELPVSTSRFGLGTEEGSNRTPLGSFRICEKYGARAPEGTIFKGRKPIGYWSADEESEEDLVLTRIFRLESDDPETSNTYQRYIYFHGTNQEQKIGSPASHGCIRLSNRAIADLYPLVPVGTPVYISNNPFS